MQTFQVSEGILELIKRADGTNSLEDLLSIADECKYGLSREDILRAIKILERERILMEYTTDAPPPAMSTSEGEYYKRQLNYFEELFGPEKYQVQLALKNSVVAIFGLGGIGSWLAQALATSGVGTLKLVDYDVVEFSNLARQSLYRVDDVGKSKTECAKYSLERQNPHVRIETHDLRISDRTSLDSIVSDCSLIINCMDEPSVEEAGNYTDKYAMALRIPEIITGGYSLHAGFIGPTIIPYKTTCWPCHIDYEKRQDHFANHTIIATSDPNYAGLLVPVAPIIANIHAIEAIYILTGLQKPLMTNKKGEIDFRTLNIKFYDVGPREGCSNCSDIASPGLRAD